MAVPLAATAAVAYLDAKYQIFGDMKRFYKIVKHMRHVQKVADSGKINLFYVLEERVKTSPNHPFIIVPPPIPNGELSLEQVRALKPREYSYRQVYDIVLQYAAWLKNEHGIKKDDIVALVIPNKVEFVFVWYALFSLGARAAFINTSLRHEALLHCVKLGDASHLIVHEELKEALTDDVITGLDGKTTPVVLDEATISRVATMQGHRACDDCRLVTKPDTMAMLIYTSGTTGLPKAANISWRRVYIASNAYAELLDISPRTRFYTALPLYHSSASSLAVGLCLFRGGTVIIAPHFSARNFIPSVIATRANGIHYIGEMCRYLTSSPPSPLDQAHEIEFAFGNGLRPDVWRTFKERFAIPTIWEFYSATESPASSMIKSSNNFGQGAIGHSGPLMHLLWGSRSALIKLDIDTSEPIRDPATGLCVEAGVGEPGELLAWLDPDLYQETFNGYWKNDGATNKKLLRNVRKKDDLFFRTGDLLSRDAEGRTFFVDRIGDTFRWKGENVSTREVEKAVSLHGAVAEANVYGVSLPSHDGRAGCAAVIFKQGEPDAKTLRALTAHVQKQLPKYALPLFIRKVETMAVTGTNKHQKTQLQSQGVDPAKVGSDALFWLCPKNGVYRPFEEKDWQGLVGGQTKL